MCQDITRDVMLGLQENKALKQIRQEVDARYGPLGKGTPTPPPG